MPRKKVVVRDGVEYWYLGEELHRLDGPAVIYPDGSSLWFRHDMHHRTNGPAIDMASGFRVWMQNDEVHRTHGPAMIYPDGTEVWYYKGQRINSQRRKQSHVELNTVVIHSEYVEMEA